MAAITEEKKRPIKNTFRVFGRLTPKNRPGNLGAVARVWDYPQPPYLRDSRVSSSPRTYGANWGAQ